MGGNTFGILFKVTTFGESHGAGLGCVIDGCPAGLLLSGDDIKLELARRRPGKGAASTERNEEDKPEILSGVFEGKTLGTPLAILVRNENQRSRDYDNIKDTYRPGHADWSWEAKFGFRDYRGGGRSSGRETLGRVAAGAVAKVFLASCGIKIQAWTSSAAGIKAPARDESRFDIGEIENNPLRMPDRVQAALAMEKIEILKSQGDSAGCSVSCAVINMPAGLGEPVFNKLDAAIAGAMLSIGAAKAVEFGAGFSVSCGTGSGLNDVPRPAASGAGQMPCLPPVSWKTNNSGGVLGGISNGNELFFTVAFKPVPSIAKKQETVNRQGEKIELAVHGRHDVCLAPRLVPVVEAMTALVLADFLLLQRSARI